MDYLLRVLPLIGVTFIIFGVAAILIHLAYYKREATQNEKYARLIQEQRAEILNLREKIARMHLLGSKRYIEIEDPEHALFPE